MRAVDGWTVEAASLWEARQFVRLYHYARSSANTGTYVHALRRVWQSYGFAIWIPPTRGAAESVAGEAWRGVLCLSRLVVAPDVPANGASFLLGRSMAMVDRSRWPVLLTYADTRLGHTGAIYRATNWTCLGPVAAGDVWVHSETGEQAGRKRGPRTWLASEMVAAGYIRQPSDPKIKFIHRTSQVAALDLHGGAK